MIRNVLVKAGTGQMLGQHYPRGLTRQDGWPTLTLARRWGCCWCTRLLIPPHVRCGFVVLVAELLIDAESQAWNGVFRGASNSAEWALARRGAA